MRIGYAYGLCVWFMRMVYAYGLCVWFMRMVYVYWLCVWFTREVFPEDNFGPDNSALGILNGTIMHPAPHVSVEYTPRGVFIWFY